MAEPDRPQITLCRNGGPFRPAHLSAGWHPTRLTGRLRIPTRLAPEASARGAHGERGRLSVAHPAASFIDLLREVERFPRSRLAVGPR
jgi:hypothetical protein